MVSRKTGKWRMLVIFLCLVTVCWTYAAEAQQIGDWSGYFVNGGGADYFDHPMTVGQDGSVTLLTTVPGTFLDQNSSTRVLDQAAQTIDFTLLMTSPKTFAAPLAAGSYVVRIGRGLQDKYGSYSITANLAPASVGATETENNDLISGANTNPDNLFAGAIGYIRSKDVKDLADYFRFTLTEDTNVHFNLTAADTLVTSDTVLSLRNAGDVQLNYTYLSTPSKVWDLYLAAGAYYLRLFTHDFSKYGGYAINTTTTSAVSQSSETEINDSIAAANPIPSKTLHGSIGYFRGKDGSTENWDNYDFFSCEVTEGGALSLEILSDATLHSYNNTISIRNGSNTQLNYAYLSGSPRSVTLNDLNAGTYFILVYAAVGHGAYQINISGNVILASKSQPGIDLLLLDSE